MKLMSYYLVYQTKMYQCIFNSRYIFELNKSKLIKNNLKDFKIECFIHTDFLTQL